MNVLQQLLKFSRAAVPAFVRSQADWRLSAILRRGIVVARLFLLHPNSLLGVIGALSSPKLAALVKASPILLLKFSWNIYAHGLSTAERAAMITNHYRWLDRLLSPGFLENVSLGRQVLWEAYREPARLGISIAVTAPTMVDGELTLYFQFDAIDVYMLSFVIVPANGMGMADGQGIFITQLQGVKGRGNQIAIATKSVGGISPALLLMAAVQGFALALKIEHIFGVDASQQISLEGRPVTVEFSTAYDEFWNSIGGRKLARGVFLFPVPLPEKSMRLIKRNHRGRVKNRRAFRNAVAVRARTEMERFLSG